MEHNLVVDVLGWVGAVALLSAYGLVSTNRLTGDSERYQVLNLVGAVLLIVNGVHYGAYPSVGVNVVWIGIGVFALLQVRRGRQARSQARGGVDRERDVFK